MTFCSRLVMGALLLGTSALLPHSAAAQSGGAAARQHPAVTPAKAAIGTFQIIALTDKAEVGLTTEALAEIEARRQETDEVSWVISPYARVRILPRRVITAPGFRPVPVQVPYHAAR